MQCICIICFIESDILIEVEKVVERRKFDSFVPSLYSVCRSVLIQPGQEESEAQEESNLEEEISAEDEIYAEKEIDIEEDIEAKEDVDEEEEIYAEEGIYTEDEEIYAKGNGTDSDSGKLGTLSRYIYIRTVYCTALHCTALHYTAL